jgi:dTDP-4-dehydrorhamnose reductase
MKILLTGKNGQLGSVLEEDLKNFHEVIATNRETLNLIDFQAIKNIVYQIKPNLIINAAAYTDVDKAEEEKELAYKVNALAPKLLSEAAKELDIPIIHISTDYVFDGSKKDPYVEDDQVNPLSVYGKTKWHGEEFVRLAPKHFILRTSWIFSSHGNNFLRTIFKLSQEKKSLSVVDCQWGSPTSVKTLSNAIQAIIQYLKCYQNSGVFGTYHVTSDGQTSWYLYARKILDVLESSGVQLKLKKNNIQPISSSHYSKGAMRPKNSRMNTVKFKNTFTEKFTHWENDVESTVFAMIKNKQDLKKAFPEKVSFNQALMEGLKLGNFSIIFKNNQHMQCLQRSLKSKFSK